MEEKVISRGMRPSKAWAEIVSQWFTRRKKYRPSTMFFEVSEKFIDMMEDPNYEYSYRMSTIGFEVTSSDGECQISKATHWHWVTDQGYGGWFGDERMRCMRLNKTQFLIVNWPVIKFRPFPGEHFKIEVKINHTTVAEIPLWWFK